MSTQQALIYLSLADRRQWDYVIQTVCIGTAAIQLHKADRTKKPTHVDTDSQSVSMHTPMRSEGGTFIYRMSITAFYPAKFAVKPTFDRFVLFRNNRWMWIFWIYTQFRNALWKNIDFVWDVLRNWIPDGIMCLCCVYWEIILVFVFIQYEILLTHVGD